MGLVVDAYELMIQLSESIKYGLISQMNRSSISIPLILLKKREEREQKNIFVF